MARSKSKTKSKSNKKLAVVILATLLVGGVSFVNPTLAGKLNSVLSSLGLVNSNILSSISKQNSPQTQEWGRENVITSTNSAKALKASETPKGHQTKFCTNQNLLNGVQPEINKGFNKNLLNLCYSGFNAMYKHDYRIALWVAEKLTPEREQEAKKGGRESSFYPDPNVQAKFGASQTIKTEHYTGSGFDRGHLAASRDLPLNDRFESYYMSNIVPQTPENNRNIWANIEAEARCFVQKYKTDVYVVNIPALNVISGTMKTLSTPAGKVVIPNYMIKAVYVPAKGYVGAYFTNNDDSKTYFKRISLAEVKKLSLINPFPQLDARFQTSINLPACNKGKNALGDN